MTGATDDGLDWLPRPAADFRRTVKDRLSGDGPVPAAELVALATHAMDLDQATSFDKALRRAEPRIEGQLARVRMALVARGTVDLIAPALRVAGLRHGVLPEIYLPDYDAGMHEAMDPSSGLGAFAPEVALVAETAQGLGLDRATMDESEAARRVEGALGTISSLADALVARGARTMILQTVPLQADPWTGHLDRSVSGSPAAQVEAFNAGLGALARERGALILDADMLAGLVGRARWHDPAMWHRAKVPMAIEWVPLYADHVGRLLRALRGLSAKCLVLDLDNTLWGGVVGDEGVEGIRIGQGSADGEAHLALQRYALSLQARGVVLAVCSKNEEAAARAPFEAHPDMALRLDDIAVFAANWTDKASNLAHIASTLNIAVDALVFVDDNPAERARVRQMLPMVAVPELGHDPATYPGAVARAGYFETIGLSADDAGRAEQYRANARRAQDIETFGNYDAYLASLEMVCTIAPFDAVGRTRIAQLVNKSNQFNLTTRRRGEAEVAALEADPAVIDLQVRLVDRFGDNGMISVVVFREAEIEGARAWLCDTWLMSCRVLGRRVQEAVLAHVVRAAREAGVTRLCGDYLPTSKNAMVAAHFTDLGFERAGDLGGGGVRFRLDVATHEAPDLPMEVRVPGAPILRTSA